MFLHKNKYLIYFIKKKKTYVKKQHAHLSNGSKYGWSSSFQRGTAPKNTSNPMIHKINARKCTANLAPGLIDIPSPRYVRVLARVWFDILKK